MCVSSREEEPWLDHFNNYPRLTVHLTTDPDIETMIRNAIGEHPNFEVFEPWKARWFIDHFVQIAEGVFLWAKLILVDVVAMLDYKKGLRDLRQALESYPPELDGLFEKIMRDKVRNNEEALTILKIMIELREDTIVRDHDLIASEFVIRQYSLVGDALSGKIQCRNQWPKEGAWEEEQERVGKFIANLPLLFGGLVTLTSDDYSIETLNFSHRSVYQYLVGNLQYNSLDEAKIRATALQCLVAGMRVYESGCGRYDQFYDEDVYFTKAVLQWIVKSDEITQEICFPWLEEMEQHFVRLSDDINVSEKDSNPKSKLDLEARRGPCWILVLSACYDLASYMEWALSRSTCTSQWITTTQAQAATLDYLIFIWFDCDSFRVFAGDLLRSLRVFLLEKADRQWTIDSNAVVSTRSCGQVSIWQYFIIRMTMNAGILGLYPEIWDAVGVFLECGARPDIYITWTVDGMKQEVSDYLQVLDMTFLSLTDITVVFPNSLASEQGGLEADDRCKINRLTMELLKKEMPNGGSLRDIFLLFGPKGRPDIQKLLEAEEPVERDGAKRQRSLETLVGGDEAKRQRRLSIRERPS